MGKNNQKTIGIITFEKKDNRVKGSIGSSRIRGQWIWQNWHEAEEFMIGKKYETVIFQKVYWLMFANAFKGIKIFDICDPDHLDGQPVIEMINLCDAVTTSTQALADYYRQFTTKPIYYIPDRIDLNEFKFNRKGKHEGRGKKIVWFGYHHNADNIEKTLYYIREKLLELTIISDQQIIFGGENRDYQPKFIKWSWPKCLIDLAKHDFAILPTYLKADMRQRYKSNNKDLYCWALGLPIAKEPNDLERLLSPEIRNEEVEKNYQKLKKWDIKYSIEELKGVLIDVQKARKTRK